MKLAVSTYSFHRFGQGPEKDEKPSLSALIDTCAILDLDGIELLALHIDSTAPEALYSLKQYAFQNGIQIIAVSASHNFVTPDPAQRLAEIDKLCRWIDVAYELGAPAVRAFGGRWGTISDFSKLMTVGGIEPPLPDFTDDDGYAWSIEAFKVAAHYAGRKGVTLALENHWGLTHNAAGVLRILRGVDSPWLKAVIDIGNFELCPDPYAEMAALTPHAIMVHAKTYMGGGLLYTANLDYKRVADTLRQGGFGGYVSIEFEGKAHPDDAIPESITLLRDAFALEHA